MKKIYSLLLLGGLLLFGAQNAWADYYLIPNDGASQGSTSYKMTAGTDGVYTKTITISETGAHYYYVSTSSEGAGGYFCASTEFSSNNSVQLYSYTNYAHSIRLNVETIGEYTFVFYVSGGKYYFDCKYNGSPTYNADFYIYNSGNLTDLKIYSWTDDGTKKEYNGSWRAAAGASSTSVSKDSKTWLKYTVSGVPAGYTLNVIFSSSSNQTSDIVVGLINSSKEYYYELNGSTSGEPARYNYTKYYNSLCGGFNAYALDNYVFVGETCPINLNAAWNYEFKVVDASGNWYGLSTLSYILPSTSGGWLLSKDNDKNCGITTSIRGSYTFHWNASTKYVWIDYPSSYSRTGLTAGAWGTLCVPVQISSVTGATLYQIHSKNSTNNGVILASTNTYYAGNAYIFKLDAEATSISVGLNNSSYDDGANNFQGLFGTYYTTTINNDGNATDLYVLSGGELKLAAEKCIVAENRAYINYSSVPNYVAPTAPGVRYLEVPMAPENATDIKSIEANEKAIKFIKNGQIFIQKNGVVYDVTGRAVR